MMYTPMSAVATAACMGCYVPLTGLSTASAGHTSYRHEYRADYEPYQPLEAVASFPALSAWAPVSSRKAVQVADVYCDSSSAPSTAPSTASSISSDDSSNSSTSSGKTTGSWFSKAISRAVGISSTKRSRTVRTSRAEQQH